MKMHPLLLGCVLGVVLALWFIALMFATGAETDPDRYGFEDLSPDLVTQFAKPPIAWGWKK